MKLNEDKMSQFLHVQLEKQRHDEMVQKERRDNNLRNEERRRHVMAQAEQRKEELLAKMNEGKS